MTASDVISELTGPLEYVFSEIRSRVAEFSEEPALWDQVMGFVHAINWRERWIQGVLVFHATVLLLVLTTRKNTSIQGALFFLLMGLVYSAERLNNLGAQRWREFATQPYFDPSGVFISIMLSGPALLWMLVILVNYLLEAVALMVKMKRKQLQHQARTRVAAAAATGESAGPGPPSQDGTAQDKKRQ